FLKASVAGRASADDLLRNPEEIGAMWGLKARPKPQTESLPALAPFRNEPVTDFTRPDNREAMTKALKQVRGQFGQSHGLWIGPPYVSSGAGSAPPDPGAPPRVTGRSARAQPPPAEAAVAAARRAFGAWSATPVADRAAVLVRAAGIMRERRFELA